MQKTDRDRYHKEMLGFRVLPKVRRALVLLSEKLETRQVDALERAILELAEREGVEVPDDETRK